MSVTAKTQFNLIFGVLMRVRLLVPLFFIVCGVAVAKPMPRTVQQCYEVKCTIGSVSCITIAQGNGIDVIIPGIADIKKVPCNGRVVVNPVFGTGAFVHTETSTGDGLGWTNADAVVDAGEGYVTEYDDSRIFTSYSEWYTAAHGIGPFE